MTKEKARSVLLVIVVLSYRFGRCTLKLGRCFLDLYGYKHGIRVA
jgi:hypothetical protein